jgi:hypothetical protein
VYRENGTKSGVYKLVTVEFLSGYWVYSEHNGFTCEMRRTLGLCRNKRIYYLHIVVIAHHLLLTLYDTDAQPTVLISSRRDCSEKYL